VKTAISNLEQLYRVLRRAAPYVLVELLLPGGTLFALLLFVYERRHKLAFVARRELLVAAVHAKARPRSDFLRLVRPDGAAASVWRDRRGANDAVVIALPLAA
jgi:hypothetical protein